MLTDRCVTVLLGGARSGKSTLAERWGHEYAGPVVVVATGERLDGEMTERIDRHRADRPAGWVTIEEPVDLAAAVTTAPAEALVIVDCLTTWLANVMVRDRTAEAIELVDALLLVLDQRRAPSVVISNEVGLGIVPAEAMTRGYRDLLGWINQRVVAAADTAYFLVAGRALTLEPPRRPW